MAIAAIALVAVTLVALEGVEVVQLRTTAPDGSVRTTRTWVADADGATWVEAANPERPFLRDLQAHPEVSLVRGVRSSTCMRCRFPATGRTGRSVSCCERSTGGRTRGSA
ncbi:MAG TPA: hypothetical protein VJ829_06460 [Candidatus Binatia bacterium]|nr:hypothetical protein [Candidatus Binatia bacterium]